jgi:splicing suppressor protein 51
MNIRLAARHSLRLAHPRHTRSFFGLFKRKEQRFTEPKPFLSEDNLFHPFSKSPFPAIRARGEAIKQLAPCPVCSSSHEHVHAHTKAQPKAVGFECPDCGWPTHCSEEHWAADKEHQKYCSRLREVNEDEHDLRSGRKIHEFDLPGTGLLWSAIRRPSFPDYSTQDHRMSKQQSHSRTGTCFGIPVGSLR